MIKKGAFVELELVGKVKETNEVFDVTSAENAKKYKVFNPQAKYERRVICVGERHLVDGLDDFLIGKELKQYTVTLTPERAFGKKDAKLMKIVPLSLFKKQQVQPFPGLQLNIDGILGTVKTVSGGRVILDFNHPLAGREVVYEIDLKKIIANPEEQARCLLKVLFQRDIDLTLKEKVLTIQMQLPEQVQEQLRKKIKELIPVMETVTFKKEEKKEKPVKGKAAKK